MCHRVICGEFVPPDEIGRTLDFCTHSDGASGSADVKNIRAKLLRVADVKRRITTCDDASIVFLATLFGVKICLIKEHTHSAVSVSHRRFEFLAVPDSKHLGLDGLASAHGNPGVFSGVVGG